VRILLVSRGFPPRARWGTEYYTQQLARGLRERGHRIEVLHPVQERDQPLHSTERVESDGFPVHLVNVRAEGSRPLSESYEDAGLELVFDRLLAELEPDLVHFHYLLWGLSARMPGICRARGIPSVLTLTDFGPLCHRGQMFDWRLRDCGGPHPAAVCARCIREPAPFDGPAAQVFAKRWAARALALLGGAGVVVTTRDVERREACIRECLDALDHVIAPTEVFESVFLEAGVPREKLSRLVYAIDTAPLALARSEPSGADVTIGYLGQYSPHKGPDVLLDAVRILEHRLPESVEPWKVVFYGAGLPRRHRRFPAAIFPSAISKRVSVHGPVEASGVPQLMADLHAVVVPSVWIENAPLIALQARAAGVPVIASDVAGLREIVEPGVHGRLFPAGDALALANALRDVILRRVPRVRDPRPPLELAEHLSRLEELYRSLAPRARRSSEVSA
jgi:glycosyltransferase involved in cell wall biosynthesis